MEENFVTKILETGLNVTKNFFSDKIMNKFRSQHIHKEKFKNNPNFPNLVEMRAAADTYHPAPNWQAVVALLDSNRFRDFIFMCFIMNDITKQQMFIVRQIIRTSSFSA